MVLGTDPRAFILSYIPSTLQYMKYIIYNIHTVCNNYINIYDICVLHRSIYVHIIMRYTSTYKIYITNIWYINICSIYKYTSYMKIHITYINIQGLTKSLKLSRVSLNFLSQLPRVLVLQVWATTCSWDCTFEFMCICTKYSASACFRDLWHCLLSVPKPALLS